MWTNRRPVLAFAIIVMLFVMFATEGMVGAAQEQAVVQVANLNVRGGPGTNFEVVGRVTSGDKLPVIHKENDWYQVTLTSGNKGWIAGWLVKLEEQSNGDSSSNSAMAAIPGVAVVTGTYVNIRSGPGTEHDVIHRVHQGQEVKITGQEEDWFRLELAGGQSGWIAGWLVEQKPGQASPVEHVQEPVEQLQNMVAVIQADVVNVRNGAGTGFSILSKTKRGDRFPVIGQQEDWLQLDLGNGLTGWVAGWLAEVVEEEINSQVGVDDREQSQEQANQEAGGDKVEPLLPEIVEEDSHEGEVDVNIPEHLTQIKAIFLREAGSGVELVVNAGKPITGYNIFTLKDPDRLVLDLEQAAAIGVEAGKVPAGNKLITGIRVGQFTPEQVRVVIDLTQPVASSARYNSGQQELIVPISQGVLTGKTIVIDPGHGGINSIGIVDPGAIGATGLYEKDVVLDISLQLQRMLEQNGAKVVLTRTGSSTNLTLEGRAELANDLGADIFVSVHTNASLSPLQNGTSVFYHAPNGSELGLQRSSRRLLAQSIQTELVKELKLRDMGIRENNFAVLRHTKMPSVLVEVAYISNPAEERLLADRAFRKQSAEAIMRGILRYFAQQ